MAPQKSLNRGKEDKERWEKRKTKRRRTRRRRVSDHHLDSPVCRKSSASRQLRLLCDLKHTEHTQDIVIYTVRPKVCGQTYFYTLYQTTEHVQKKKITITAALSDFWPMSITTKERCCHSH